MSVVKSMYIRKRDNSAYRGIFIEYLLRTGPYQVNILCVNVAGMKSVDNITLSDILVKDWCYGVVIGTSEALPDFCEYGSRFW